MLCGCGGGCDDDRIHWNAPMQFEYSNALVSTDLVGSWMISSSEIATHHPKRVLLRDDIFDPFLNHFLLLQQGDEPNYVEVVDRGGEIVLSAPYSSSLLEYALEEYYSWRDAMVFEQLDSVGTPAIWRLEKRSKESLWPGRYIVTLKFIVDKQSSTESFIVGGTSGSNLFLWRFKHDNECHKWSEWRIPEDVNIWLMSYLSDEKIDSKQNVSATNLYFGFQQAYSNLLETSAHFPRE